MKKYIIILIGLVLLGGATYQNKSQMFGGFSDPFVSIQLAPSPSNGNCLTTDGTDNAWGSCGTGGGSGGGSWSTTTSQTSGVLFNYPNNATDVVLVGSNSSTTAEVYFDPNTQRYQIGSSNTASTTLMGLVQLPTLSQGGAYIGSNKIIQSVSTSTISVSTGLTYSGTMGSMFGGSSGNLTVNTSQNIATLSNLTSNGAILTSGGVGTLGIYAGTSCTNQFVRSLSGSIVATCATVGAADVSLANLTATDSTLTFSGTYTGATARTIGLNLGNANTWTVNQTFNYSSSTVYSSFLTASTTFLNIGGDVFNNLEGDGLLVSGNALLFDCSDVAGTGLTCSGEDLTVTDITCTDCLNATEIEDIYLLNSGDVGTGVYDFGGATSFEIPNGTGPTLNAIGILALDTTSNNLVLATSTTGHIVVASATTTLYSFTASTTAITSGTIIDMPSKGLPQVLVAMWCKVSSGTSIQIFISDGTNDTNTITCTTTGTQFALTSNNTFTANEAIRMEFGTKTGDTGYLTVDLRGYRTSD